MKYLKAFENLRVYHGFELDEDQEEREFKQTIIEICYDLEDLGLNVEFSTYFYKYPTLIIYKYRSEIIINDEIKDVLLRIKDFAGNNFNHVSIWYGRWKNYDNLNIIPQNIKISAINIMWKKSKRKI